MENPYAHAPPAMVTSLVELLDQTLLLRLVICDLLYRQLDMCHKALQALQCARASLCRRLTEGRARNNVISVCYFHRTAKYFVMGVCKAYYIKMKYDTSASLRGFSARITRTIKLGLKK